MADNCKMIRSRKWGFTVIQNPVLNDQSISLKAKGLYCFMQSKPDSWEFSIAGLCAELSEGKAAVRAALGELKKAGYLSVEQLRDERGRLSTALYTLYDAPQTESVSAQPLSDFRQTDNPSSENRTEINKDLNKDLLKQIPPVAPRGGGAGFERVWAAYPKHSNRHAAEKAWRRLKPSPQLVETMIAAIRGEQSRSQQWQREDGRFIPALSRWLTGRRWEDEQSRPFATMNELGQQHYQDDLALALMEMRHGMLPS